MCANIKSNSKAWIFTKIAHQNVSLRLGKDLSLETKKLQMSHCFVDVDVKCATPILMSLSWIFSNPNNSIVLKIWEPWLAIKIQIIYRICCPSGLFSSMLLVIITLTLQILGKIVTLSRVIWIINYWWGRFTLKNLVLKFWVTISRCSINKGDIIKVRVHNADR